MCLARPMLTTCLTPYPSDIPVLIKMWRLYTCGSYYYALLLGGALSDDTRLTSVCLTSLLRLTSVAYIRPAGGRHMRPAGRSAGMARIGSSGPAGPAWLKAAAGRFHCRGRGHIVAASRTAFFSQPAAAGSDNVSTGTLSPAQLLIISCSNIGLYENRI